MLQRDKLPKSFELSGSWLANVFCHKALFVANQRRR
jgi:hypothetical protein